MLAALVASLRQELAEALDALAEMRGELVQARERIAELEARPRQTPRFSELGLHPRLRRVRLVLAASVSDGVDDEVEVGLVEPGDGVTQGDRCGGGEAGG